MSTSATPVQLIDPNTGQPYSAASSPTTTSANPGSQSTQATSVQGVNGGNPVAVSEADGANVALGARADAAASADTGTFSLIALFKRLLAGITTISGNQTNGNQFVTILGAGKNLIASATAGGTNYSLSDLALCVRNLGYAYNPGTNAPFIITGDGLSTFVVNKGGSNIATGQVSVGTSSTLVAAARAGRQKITLSPTSSVVYYVGASGVTPGTGLYVAAGASITMDTNAAIYAVGASAVTMSFIEYF